MAIEFLKGDATLPQAKGNKIIVHICNDLGSWGKGFVLAVSRRWSEPEREYRRWYKEHTSNDFSLGAVQFIQVEPYIWVANMIGQHGIKSIRHGSPIRYEAVEECLGKVAKKARELDASVHMPRIGCGLAGGRWELIEPIVIQRLCSQGVAVTVYDYE